MSTVFEASYTELKKLEAEIERLRKGITDYLHGDYSRTRKNDKCKHGRYGFEGCENCIDDYFEQLMVAE
jgi:hypothetical protein